MSLCEDFYLGTYRVNSWWMTILELGPTLLDPVSLKACIKPGSQSWQDSNAGFMPSFFHSHKEAELKSAAVGAWSGRGWAGIKASLQGCLTWFSVWSFQLLIYQQVKGAMQTWIKCLHGHKEAKHYFAVYQAYGIQVSYKYHWGLRTTDRSIIIKVVCMSK